MHRIQPKSSYSMVRTTKSVFMNPKKYSSHGYRRFYKRDYLNSRLQTNRVLMKNVANEVERSDLETLQLTGEDKYSLEKMDVIKNYGKDGFHFRWKRDDEEEENDNKKKDNVDQTDKMLSQNYDRMTYSRNGTIDNFTQFETSGYNFTQNTDFLSF